MLIFKSREEIGQMRSNGRRLAWVMAVIEAKINPGVNLRELDALARQEIAKVKAVPSFLGYKSGRNTPSFPAALCASVDNEIVHGPATRDIVLKEGSIVGLDLGLLYNGWHADMAVTVPVGKISLEAASLLKITKEALVLGIKQAMPNTPLVNLSRAIYRHAEKNGVGVVTSFVGHGIGRGLHEEPVVPNFPTPEAEQLILKPGITLAIEPMFTLKNSEVDIAEDKWTAITADSSLAAHFEHTIAVSQDGPKILTKI